MVKLLIKDTKKMATAPEILFAKAPLDYLEILLKVDLTTVFKGRLKSDISIRQQYANHLISKIAIQASSFYFLSNGIIEHKKSNEQTRLNGYDLFTVNTVFRAIMESYATFHNIFIEPTTEQESEFRFLLWKIDGLVEKNKFNVHDDDFEGVQDILKIDKEKLNNTIGEFESCQFYKSLDKSQLKKIYNSEKRRYNWRFRICDGEIEPLNISKLIEYVYKIRAFVNFYRYSSIHTHSNYYAIEEFERIKGKQIHEDTTEPPERLANLVIMRLIGDLSDMDNNAHEAYLTLDIEIRKFIEGMNKTQQ